MDRCISSGIRDHRAAPGACHRLQSRPSRCSTFQTETTEVNAMITIFEDFYNFLGQKWRSALKPILLLGTL
jgi:hypothetical protein